MNTNIRENILTEMFRICKEENFNSKIFRFKKSVSDQRKKIREEYINMMSSFLSSISIYKIETKNKTKQTLGDIELCFEGVFRNFLKSIKEKYKKEIWRTRK
jgi:hypothetical protein